MLPRHASPSQPLISDAFDASGRVANTEVLDVCAEIGRALITVMETYQQQGGSIAVPDALQRYIWAG